MQETKERSQWLQLLFYIQLVNIGLSCISRLSTVLPVLGLAVRIHRIQPLLDLSVVFCLFLLPWYYRLSAICKAVWLLVSLYPRWLPKLLQSLEKGNYASVAVPLGYLVLVLSVAALFLECRSHGRAVPSLKGKWMLLFGLSAGISLLSQLTLELVGDRFNQMMLEGITWGIQAYNMTTLLLGLGVSVFYLLLLYQTVNMATKEEGNYGN